MNRCFKAISLVWLAVLLAACASQDITDYAQVRPQLDPVQFFSGRTQAWGMFQKRGGEVARRFHVTIDGAYDGRQLTLDERFLYDDGETQRRLWTLHKQADGTWRGTAGDVRGEALGEVAGNTLHWRYTLALPVKGTTYEVQMDDWMYLVDDKTMINRASMRKFGIEVGQVTLFFRKGD